MAEEQLNKEEQERDKNLHEDNMSNEEGIRGKVYYSKDKDNKSNSKIKRKRSAKVRRSKEQKLKGTVKIPPGVKNKKEYLKAAAKTTANKTNAPVEMKEAPRDNQPSSGAGGGGGGGTGGSTTRPQPLPPPPPSWLPSAPPPIPPTGTNPTSPTTPVTDRGTPNGLKEIKPGAIKGPAHPGVYAMAHAIQEAIPNLDRFTAFNDAYHEGTSSFHAKGLAGDFTLTNKTAGSQAAAEKVRELFRQNGIRGVVINEYVNRTARTTGGHIHYNFASAADAAKAQVAFGGGGGVPGGVPGGTPGGTPGGSVAFNPNNVKRGAVSMSDRVALAKAAGFSDRNAVIMGAISQAESSGNSNAFNPRGRDLSSGLWQINMIGSLGIERDALFKRLIPGYTNRNDLFDPYKNAQAAKIIFDREGLGAWSTYRSGAFKRYMNDAVNGIGAGSEWTSNPGGGGSGGNSTVGAPHTGPNGTSPGNQTGPGLYPALLQGLNINNANNPFALGQPLPGILSLAQFLQQDLRGFGNINSFTNPPPGVDPFPYEVGLVIDLKIVDPTIEKSQIATSFIEEFLLSMLISATVENFYLTANPITNGYIHIELRNISAANRAFFIFSLITYANDRLDGLILVQ